MGLRIGAALGALFALIVQLAVRPRRARPISTSVDFVLPARESAPVRYAPLPRRHPVRRFFACLLGFAMAMVGSAGSLVTGLLLADGRASDRLMIGMPIFSGGLLVAGIALLWPRGKVQHSRADAWGRPYAPPYR